MRGARLKSLTVLHHRFDREGGVRTREAFRFGLFSRQYGHSHKVFREIGIHIKHLTGLRYRLLRTRVNGVPLLPEKFGSSQKKPRAHLPANDVGPLINE